MKRRLKRKFFWLNEWNISEQEAWFTDMALEGWELIELDWLFATFAESEPQEVVYRCDVLDVESLPDQQRMERYRKSGWEFVDSRKHIQVFREREHKPASEVYTTSQERASALSLFQKKLRNKGLITIFLSLITFWLHIITIKTNPVQNYLEDSFILLFYMTIFLIIAIISTITSIVEMRKLIKRLISTGEAIDEYTDYRLKMNRKRFFTIFQFIVVISLIIATITTITINDENWYDEIPANDLPVVQLSDMIDSVDYGKVISTESSGNYYIVGSSILVPKQYELHENVQVPDEKGNSLSDLSIISYGYEARNKWLAEKLAQALRKKYLTEKIMDESIANDNFDEIWMEVGDSYLGIIVRKGTEIRHLIYYGIDPVNEEVEKILSIMGDNF